MAVAREVNIDYDGKTYVFVPHNSILRVIEEVVPIIPYVGRANKEPLASHTAYVMSIVAAQSGQVLLEDDVYEYLVNDLANNGGAEYFRLVGRLSDAFVPPSAAKNSNPSEAENPPVPRDSKPKPTEG